MAAVDRRMMFIGATPPPYGGIASHFVDLLEILNKEGKENFFFYDPSKSGSPTSRDGMKLGDKPNPYLTVLNPFFILYFLFNLHKFLQIFFTIKKISKSKHKIVPENFPFYFLYKLINCLQLIKKHHINSISAYHTFPEALYPYMIKKYFRPDMNYTVTVFGELQANTIDIEACGEIYKLALQNADMLMASSNYCAKGVEVLGLDAAKVRVVPYGINIEHFKRKTEYKLSERKHTLLLVGHINKRMGLECLVKALSILAPKFPFLKVAMVGKDHGYLKEFLGLVSSAQLVDRVTILQDVKFDLLPEFYNSSYIYVNPMNTRLPCMGLAMKEAMAAELPVIASNTGGIPEAVVDGVTGLVYQTDNHVELARCIEKLLEAPDLARSFGMAGRERAKEIFDREKSTMRIINMLSLL
ncbi:MAG: glycosyltransferase family 4 protein [Oligoflexales bacterium]|nr:glycosyltransferase family 4 protein [Oligoflexales bacterium]